MSNDPFSGMPFALAFMMFVFAIGLWIAIAAAAYRVAPRDRSWDFFWATLVVLGPLGIAAALIAQPRDPALAAPPRRPVASGRRRFNCPRCGAENDIPESDRSYDCWRCSEHRAVQTAKTETTPPKPTPS
jgi:DNA-directed RNA polymerase subunit RPC12/RpoP